LTKKEAKAEFDECIVPVLPCSFDGSIDLPRLREAWNNFTDALHKEGCITDWQYENWDNPY